MKKIVLYNPSVSSLNMGDHIIFDSVKVQLKNLLKEAFIVDISTHLPVSNFLKHIGTVDYKFVCGTNLLRGKMNRRFRQWDINIFNAERVGPCILLGTGWWQYGDNPNFYTKMLYKNVLSKKVIHSVRDSYTENQLKKMGINNVINTSCPTMWGLTKEHCEDIPISKSEEVVCTITDYKQDKIRDKYMLSMLSENYKRVYLWIQGYGDYEYYQDLRLEENKIKLISPNLRSFDEVLKRDIDYVGTRLHAGIRALQKKKRTIIIGVDNRAKEKQKDFNLNFIPREELELLPKYVNSNFETEINIPIDNINKWKNQFKEFI